MRMRKPRKSRTTGSAIFSVVACASASASASAWSRSDVALTPSDSRHARPRCRPARCWPRAPRAPPPPPRRRAGRAPPTASRRSGPSPRARCRAAGTPIRDRWRPRPAARSRPRHRRPARSRRDRGTTRAPGGTRRGGSAASLRTVKSGTKKKKTPSASAAAGREEQRDVEARPRSRSRPTSVGRASPNRARSTFCTMCCSIESPDQPQVGLERAHVRTRGSAPSGAAVTPIVRPNRSSPCVGPWSRLAMPTSSLRRLSRSIAACSGGGEGNSSRHATIAPPPTRTPSTRATITTQRLVRAQEPLVSRRCATTTTATRTPTRSTAR